MTQNELQLLSRTIFRHLAENVQTWRDIPVEPDAPEDIEKSPGYTRWRKTNFRHGQFEANRRIIMDAESHLESMGYRCTSVRNATPGTVSVRVANSGSWRLCVRVPEDMAERIMILGFLPEM